MPKQDTWPELAGTGRGPSGSPAITRQARRGRERAIVALLSTRTLGEAAKSAGLGERTLRRWLSEDAEFRDAVMTARRATFDAAVERVQGLMGAAVNVLEDLMLDARHPAARLGAAKLIIELAINRSDAEQLVARIEQLEETHSSRRGAAAASATGRSARRTHA